MVLETKASDQQQSLTHFGNDLDPNEAFPNP